MRFAEPVKFLFLPKMGLNKVHGTYEGVSFFVMVKRQTFCLVFRVKDDSLELHYSLLGLARFKKYIS